MLTPDYLNLIEFNDVVELYNKLNIDIMADIIKRVSRRNYITETTKNQLKVLLQTNGEEIFNEVLEKTAMLNAEVTKELRQLFKDVAKEDLNGYKDLYNYKDKPFKLSESQYKILNQGLKQTNRTLKNLTSTIAFQSQQAYVNTIDEAYMKVATGAFDYNTAIQEAVNQLAKKGVTLKDKKGRDVQLEVAVRRNIMAGIQETANNINRDIEEYLGCNGYEVTAHTGARPTHAEEQGKQFAINPKDAAKYGVGLWSDVEHLWEEYNCRHSYFGIILGVSEPQYTNKELKQMKEATVKLNGEEIPYYEATQRQRAMENEIRKAKRSVQILEKAKLDNETQKNELSQLQKKYTDFCKKTGLEKDYNRIKISNNLNDFNSSNILRKNSINGIIIRDKSKNKNRFEISQKDIDNILSNELSNIKFKSKPIYNSRIRDNGKTIGTLNVFGEVKKVDIYIGKQDKDTREFLIDTLLHEELEAKILIMNTNKYRTLNNLNEDDRHLYINNVIKRYFKMKGLNYDNT